MYKSSIKKIAQVAGLTISLLLAPLALAGSFELAMAPGLAPDPNQTVRECVVTSVHDGDSMRVRCPEFKKTIPIRLEQIDAPEIDQAHGMASRDYLRSLCPRGRKVLVHDKGPDIYNRHLGRVFCDGTDANAALVAEGMAWVYDHYANDKGLYKLQDQAKAQKKGLWASKKQPMAPWDFRRQKRVNN